MIFDKLENLKMYNEISVLKEAIEYYETHDISKLELGRHEFVDKNFYIESQEYITKNPEEKRAEAHESYIDLQILLDGKEAIGHAQLCDCGKPVESCPDQDVWFYDAKVQDVVLTAGTFIILFPHDVHRPNVKVGKNSKVRKVVFKIHV